MVYINIPIEVTRTTGTMDERSFQECMLTRYIFFISFSWISHHNAVLTLWLELGTQPPA